MLLLLSAVGVRTIDNIPSIHLTLVVADESGAVRVDDRGQLARVEPPG